MCECEDKEKAGGGAMYTWGSSLANDSLFGKPISQIVIIVTLLPQEDRYVDRQLDGADT